MTQNRPVLRMVFQFLIGSLKTQIWRGGLLSFELVSIPHRQSKNRSKDT